MKSNIANNLMWKLMERFGVQGIQFILQIILARLLLPEDYGMLSIMLVFTTLANIFVQTGFNTALIQNQDVKEEDYSSVFWVTLVVAFLLYIVIFFIAPYIASFFNMPKMIMPMRIIALVLLPGALNSVQLAKISRELEFRKVFYSNMIAISVAGCISVAIAFTGGGIWTLVIQNLTYTSIVCLIMSCVSGLKIKFFCNIARVKVLISFGWKLLVSSLLETLYLNLNNLIIAKIYNPIILGYFNRGMQFPQYLMDGINNSVQSVMLPVMSLEQNDICKVKDIMRRAIMLTAYIVFPMMAGLAAVSEHIVSIFLTDKWLPCVPYMQLYCIVFAFYPVNASNLQAINAMGRSDIYLKLEVIKKILGIIILAIAVVFFNTPIAIAVSACVSILIGWFINAAPNKKLVNYTYREQLIDVLPSIVLSSLMYGTVFLMGRLHLESIVLLPLQIAVGIGVYLMLSAIIKPESYVILMNKIRNTFICKMM